MTASYSLEDPIERRPGASQLPPGNPLELHLNEVVVTTHSIAKRDGSALQSGAEVVIRGITPTPTVYLATIEPMGVTGTTGEYLDIQLPLLVRKAKNA